MNARRAEEQPIQDAIVVVGVCGAGKSRLVEGLRALGYPARECAQEHSDVPTLWRRRGRPRVLIYLDASLEAVRRRLEVRWDAAALDAQRRRLALARSSCDLYVDTDALSVEEVRRAAASYLGRGFVPHGGAGTG
ncbi:MAG: hypothetical protein QME94_01015 [Anaerolineae bacterium]|nr:hypothetical protein [Anaerolineae bacterium]